MRVLITGANGMLGRAVCTAAPAGVDVTAATRTQIDITDAAAVDRALAARPDWVINCAGYTRVDDAESHEGEAIRVNGEAVEHLGRAALAHGVRVLHVSTDYVFDGTLGRPYREDDAPNPINAYGRSKLAGETALAASGCEWTIVRTQWLYGGGASFVRTMWRKAREGAQVKVVNDQLGAPTYVAEVTAAVWRLVHEGRLGLWHATAGGYASWYDVAQMIYGTRDIGRVIACTSAEYPTAARRPLDARLDTTRLGRLRAWDAVLSEVLARGRDEGIEP